MSKKLWIGFSVSAALLLSFGLGQKAFSTTLVPLNADGLASCGQNFILLDNAEVTKVTYGTNVTGQFPATILEIKGEVLKGDKKYRTGTKPGLDGSPPLTVTFFGTQATGTIRELNPPAVGDKGMFFLTGESQIGFRNICGGIAQGYFRQVDGKYLNGLSNKGLAFSPTASKMLQSRAGLVPATGALPTKDLQMNNSLQRMQSVQDGQAVPASDLRTFFQVLVNQKYPQDNDTAKQP